MSGFRASWAGTKFIPEVPERKGFLGNRKGKTIDVTCFGWVVGATTQTIENVNFHKLVVLPDGETKVRFMDPDDVTVKREVEVV